jgi:hypothetical protein
MVMADRLVRGEPLRPEDRQFFRTPLAAPAASPPPPKLPTDAELDRVVAATPLLLGPARVNAPAPGRLSDLEREFRTLLFQDALERHEGNRSRAAADLGLSQSHFTELLFSHGFAPAEGWRPSKHGNCGPCARSKTGRCIRHPDRVEVNA